MLLQGLKHYADADVALKLWWRCNYTNYSNMYVIVSVGHVFPSAPTVIKLLMMETHPMVCICSTLSTCVTK